MAQQLVILAPGESKVVSFEATPTIAKTYQVTVDGLTGSFVVKTGAEPAINITKIKWDQMAETAWPGNYQYSPYFPNPATSGWPPHTALVTFQNPTLAGLDYQAELYLAPQGTPLRSEASASVSFHIDAGQSKSISFSFPGSGGGRPDLYNAYTMRLRITSSGKFLPGEFTLKVILPANAMGWDAPQILATAIVPDVGELLTGERRVRHVFNEQGADLSGMFAYYSDAWIMERYPTWTITYIRYRDYLINWGSFTLPGVGWNPSKLSTHVPMPQDDLTMFFIFYWGVETVPPGGQAFVYPLNQFGSGIRVQHVHYGDVLTFSCITKTMSVVPPRVVSYPLPDSPGYK